MKVNCKLLKCKGKCAVRGVLAKTLQVVRDILAFANILYLCYREHRTTPYGAVLLPGEGHLV